MEAEVGEEMEEIDEKYKLGPEETPITLRIFWFGLSSLPMVLLQFKVISVPAEPM